MLTLTADQQQKLLCSICSLASYFAIHFIIYNLTASTWLEKELLCLAVLINIIIISYIIIICDIHVYPILLVFLSDPEHLSIIFTGLQYNFYGISVRIPVIQLKIHLNWNNSSLHTIHISSCGISSPSM